MLNKSWWSGRLDLWEGNLLLEFMDALLELLLLGFSGGSGDVKGSLLLDFSGGGCSLKGLVYR